MDEDDALLASKVREMFMNGEQRMYTLVWGLTISGLVGLLIVVTLRCSGCEEREHEVKGRVYEKCLDVGKSPLECREMVKDM